MPDGGFRQSARIDNWKGVRYGINSDIEVYNLDNDISESINVAAKHPELVQKMKTIFEEERTDTPGFPYGGVLKNSKANK
jgi:hypothetical protein